MTREELEVHYPHKNMFKYWCLNCEGKDKVEQIRILLAYRFDWANWLIVRIMTHEQKIKYAIFAAEQVIKVYEDKYLGDNRPRTAIEAAKTFLKTKEKEVVVTAADAAYDAYDDADDDENFSASGAALVAVYAARVVFDATADAIEDAASAAYVANSVAIVNIKKETIEYGIELITGQR